MSCCAQADPGRAWTMLPAGHVLELRSADGMERVRWGILGTGRMATAMATEMRSMRTEGIELAAVASRSAATAEAFATRHAIGRAFGRYADLATDPDVD